jgi:hypothetical protein
MIIEDGGITSYKAKVNKAGELRTEAVSESEAQAALEKGLAYNLNTKDITSLTAGDATLMYLYNDEQQPIIIERMIIGIRGFTGLSDMATFTTISNPTGGDLISDATTTGVITKNRQVGSSKTLATGTLVYKGKAAGTVTGGDEELYGYIANNTRLDIPIGIEINKGGSYAIKLDSDATAGTAYCALVIHIKDEDRLVV